MNIKTKATSLKPLVRIGKNGLTEDVEKEIIKQLKKHKMIKIKLLRSFIESNDRKKAAVEIAKKTNSTVVQNTGFTVVLSKNI